MEGLYLTDAYLREFEARVRRAEPDGLLLDQTAFYPTGGGQPCDRGTLSNGTGEWPVVAVEKHPDGILHRVSGASLAAGTAVRGRIDWPVRYAHMRYHTALHILSGAVFRRFGSGITGGQIYADHARMDFAIPGFQREVANALIADANEVVRANRPVHVRFLSRRAAEADPSLVRVARELMPAVEEVRLIDIEGYDVQADGGTHVRSTAEVGALRLDRIENKGARNKRLILSLGGPEAAPAVEG